ncbi:MAG: helix-turn-helix transcriptional regulator [Brevundimonas sp.]|nr:helix-turn-helix transcriptional regulator [Brevundimonas sp.]
MSPVGPETGDDGRLRSAVLKAVRRMRGQSTQDLATALNMPLRTYEHFEAGHGRLNHDYMHRFSLATDCDVYGLFAAIAIGSPAFAVRTADNKFMTTFMILLQAYDRQMGDRIRDLDARSLIAAFGALFDALIETGALRAEEAGTFLEEGQQDLDAKRPKPGR